MRCRYSKTRCSGDRPVCTRCQRKQVECEYDAEPEPAWSRAVFQSTSDDYSADQHAPEFDGVNTSFDLDCRSEQRQSGQQDSNAVKSSAASDSPIAWYVHTSAMSKLTSLLTIAGSIPNSCHLNQKSCSWLINTLLTFILCGASDVGTCISNLLGSCEHSASKLILFDCRYQSFTGRTSSKELATVSLPETQHTLSSMRSAH